MLPLLKADCCENCEDLKHVKAEPPYCICARCGTDDWDCDKNLEAERLARLAERDIETAREIVSKGYRQEWAERVGDAWADVIWNNGRGGIFDSHLFVIRCMEKAEVTA